MAIVSLWSSREAHECRQFCYSPAVPQYHSSIEQNMLKATIELCQPPNAGTIQKFEVNRGKNTSDVVCSPLPLQLSRCSGLTQNTSTQPSGAEPGRRLFGTAWGSRWEHKPSLKSRRVFSGGMEAHHSVQSSSLSRTLDLIRECVRERIIKQALVVLSPSWCSHHKSWIHVTHQHTGFQQST